MLSRDAAIVGRRKALVAPCTTTHRGLPSEVELHPRVDPVPTACVTNTDCVESVSVGSLLSRLGRVSDDRMREICAALAVAVDG